MPSRVSLRLGKPLCRERLAVRRNAVGPALSKRAQGDVYAVAIAVVAAGVVINQAEWLEAGVWMPVGQLLAWPLLSKKPIAKLFAPSWRTA